MPNMVQTGLYEEDLHGTNPNNLITTETHTLQVPGVDDYYFIIPRAAPYFVSSLKVFNNQTGTLYKENLDYTIGHRFIDAMDSIGRPIAGSIRFMRRDIVGQVRLEYRTLGGNWGYDDTQILAELSRRQYNPITRVWGNIGPLPYSFPPLIHDQSLDTLVGSEDLNESLVRIADILEATAAGTAADHLKDFGNPHKVTKGQVGLGLVNDYATATEQEHVTGTRADLYATPNGVRAAIAAMAGTNLSAHLEDFNNPHKTDKAHVGLGDVANFPIASTIEAVDVTRNDRYLTPYTASLLVQRMQEDPRLDQLLADFNEHINASNPHGVTPASIGTLTEEEILALLESMGGGDASTFGGLTPSELFDKFPLNDDITGILDSLTETVEENETHLEGITVPDIVVEDNNKVITQANAQWDGYTINNRDGDVLVKGNASSLQGIATNIMSSSSIDAGYTIDASSGKILFTGSRAINPGHSNAVIGLWATDNALFWQLKGTNDDGALEMMPRSGPKVVIIPAGKTVAKVTFHPGGDTSKIMAIIDYMDTPTTKALMPYGDPGWVSAVNVIIANYSTLSPDFAVGKSHLLLAVQDRDTNKTRMRIWRINYTGGVTLSEESNDFSVVTLSGEVKTLSNLNLESHLIEPTGVKDKFILLYFDESDFALIDVNKPNSPSWDIPLNSKYGYAAISAGNDFILTLNKKGFINFWGDSPDNSLLIQTMNEINP